MIEISRRIASLSVEKRELLLRQLRDKQKAAVRSASALPQISPDPEQRYLPFPLSEIQQVYWSGRSGLFDLSTCGTNAYMELEIARADEPFLDKLNSALQQLINRHEMLRAVMLPDGRQRILPQVPPYQIEMVDLRGQEPQSVEARLAGVRERMRFQKAAIEQWPLFEFLAHRLDGQRIRLQVRFDTLLIDGASRILLVRELFQLLEDPETPLPPLECSYRDYVFTSATFKESELYKRSRDYWLGRLSTLPPAPALPLAQNISPLTRAQLTTRTVQLLEPEAWRRIKTEATRAGLTLSGLLTAAFADTLALWSKTSRFTISLVGSYRPSIHPQIQDIVGNFNTIYLLVVENSSGTFAVRAKRLQEQMMTNLEHRYFSGFEVLRELKRIRGQSSRALMPVLFNSILEYSETAYSQAKDEELGQIPLGPITLKEMDIHIPQVLLLSTVGENRDGTLLCKWQWIAEVFPHNLIEVLQGTYTRFLQRLADEKESWQESWPETARQMIPPEQLKEREAFNATEAPPSPDGELDRQALPAPGLAQPPAQKVFAAPRDTLELRLVNLWEDVLDVSPIGVTDNFFELGGQSFLAALMMAQVQKQFGQNFPPSVFFQEPTIERLAKFLRPT
jgi:acyl carrier protein